MHSLRKYLLLPFGVINLEIDFFTDESKVYITNKLPSNNRPIHQEQLSRNLESEPEANKKILVLEVWTQSAKVEVDTRASFLILLSIISYFLDYPLTTYEEALGVLTVDSQEKPSGLKVSKFIHDQVDRSSDLLRILKAVYEHGTSVNQFVVSVLNRWHKARYLEHLRSDGDVFSEESFLVYFHIMELCSNYYKNQQLEEAQDKIEKFTKELLSATLKIQDTQLEQVSQEKSKSVRSILLSDGQISIASRMFYFLDQVKLLDLKTRYFVEQLVKIRNKIAHGRPVNHREMKHPLPQFFSINSDTSTFIVELRTFTARVIAAHLSIEAWLDKWINVHRWLHVPPKYVKKFINDRSFESITSSDFLIGSVNGVRPSSLVHEFLFKRISFQELEAGLKLFLLDVEISEDSVFEVFEAAALLADSPDKVLADRCQLIVSYLYRNSLVWYEDIEDFLATTKQRGFSLVWLYELTEADA